MNDEKVLQALLAAHASQSATNLELSKLLLALFQHLEISTHSYLIPIVQDFVKTAAKQASATTLLGDEIAKIIGEELVDAVTIGISEDERAPKHES